MHWNDVEEIVESLEEDYPDEEISHLPLSELEEMIRLLPEFNEHGTIVSKSILKQILETWIEIREQS